MTFAGFVGWAKPSDAKASGGVPTTNANWWARRKSAFAHPTDYLGV
jgi:hypothetical protein